MKSGPNGVGQPKPGPLGDHATQLVYQAVQQLIECSNQQVLALVGYQLPLSQVAKVGRAEVAGQARQHRFARKAVTLESTLHKGRVKMVNKRLHDLARNGYITKVAKGRYRALALVPRRAQ